MSDPPIPDPFSVPRFAPGQIVHHRRYGYRGVVVDFDVRCRADEAWYKKNRTQPNRDQPWYHVLVDCSTVITYEAQTSLEPDTTGKLVNHPLMLELFEAFEGGRYERNDVLWPGWDLEEPA